MSELPPLPHHSSSRFSSGQRVGGRESDCPEVDLSRITGREVSIRYLLSFMNEIDLTELKVP